jgi:hypothetical protein
MGITNASERMVGSSWVISLRSECKEEHANYILKKLFYEGVGIW